MTYAIETFKLTKEFIPARSFYKFLVNPLQKERAILAINDITIQVKEAEIFGLIGLNGVGKTTLIKILSCLILPTEGEARVSGCDILKEEDKVKGSIGLVSGDERSFYWRLTLSQNLEFFATLYNLSRLEAKRKIEELSRLLGIGASLNQRLQECSAGIKQRLAIARSLLNNPRVLFMDEPTKSLDPLSAENLRNFIKGNLTRQQGKTVFFTTHNLSEVENFADRIAIMADGEIKACGTLEELRYRMGSAQATMEAIYERFASAH